jgi:hypothetical protein
MAKPKSSVLTLVENLSKKLTRKEAAMISSELIAHARQELLQGGEGQACRVIVGALVKMPYARELREQAGAEGFALPQIRQSEANKAGFRGPSPDEQIQGGQR